MLDYVKAGDYASAKTVINAAPSVGLFGLIRPVILQWIAIGAAETKGPVDLQAAIDKSGFFAPFLTYHAALMNDVLGKNAEAETSYLKATSDTKAAPYRVIQALANYYMRQGKWAEAQAVYANYVKSNPNSTLILDKIAPGEPPAPIIVVLCLQDLVVHPKHQVTQESGAWTVLPDDCPRRVQCRKD